MSPRPDDLERGRLDGNALEVGDLDAAGSDRDDLVLADGEGASFMAKEVSEEPEAVANTIRGRVHDGEVVIPELDGLDENSWASSTLTGTRVHCSMAYAPVWAA
jgi:glucosamine--fructose-6-phosphate aminotransferase (isomerizing)